MALREQRAERAKNERLVRRTCTREGEAGARRRQRVGARRKVHLVDPSKHPRCASGTPVEQADARERETLATFHIYANRIDLQRHSSCAQKDAAVAHSIRKAVGQKKVDCRSSKGWSARGFARAGLRDAMRAHNAEEACKRERFDAQGAAQGAGHEESAGGAHHGGEECALERMARKPLPSLGELQR